MFCKLIIEDDLMKPSGLGKVWPKRITRYLAPLDFEQQNDKSLNNLFNMFNPVDLASPNIHQLTIQPSKLARANHRVL